MIRTTLYDRAVEFEDTASEHLLAVGSYCDRLDFAMEGGEHTDWRGDHRKDEATISLGVPEVLELILAATVWVEQQTGFAVTHGWIGRAEPDATWCQFDARGARRAEAAGWEVVRIN